MDLPSDTESESTPESSQAEWRTIPGSPLSAQHFHQAIADIQNIDFNVCFPLVLLGFLPADPSLQEPSNYDTILVASDIIIQYLHLPDLQLSDITPLGNA
jgi:hypothetical protein